MAQLAERLLPIPEVHGLDLVIGKIFKSTYLLFPVEKAKTKKKETLRKPI